MKLDAETLLRLQETIDVELSYECMNKEVEEKAKGNFFCCTCPDPFAWDEEQVFKYLVNKRLKR